MYKAPNGNVAYAQRCDDKTSSWMDVMYQQGNVAFFLAVEATQVYHWCHLQSIWRTYEDMWDISHIIKFVQLPVYFKSRCVVRTAKIKSEPSKQKSVQSQKYNVRTLFCWLWTRFCLLVYHNYFVIWLITFAMHIKIQ